MRKISKIHIDNETRKKPYFNGSPYLSRLLSVCLCVLLVFCLSACGHTVSKSGLLSFAEETYGKCKLISEEHSGSGNDEVRTLYLKDKDTGLEYSVTSKMISLGLDGAVFGYTEQKSSDFNEKYENYVYDLAEQDLSDLNTGHPAQVLLGDFTNKVIFNSWTSDEDCKFVCKKISEIISDHDIKKYLAINFLVYCENEEICVGYYDFSSDEFESYDPYKVIDYVYENVDEDAEYRFSLGGSLDAYLSNEDLEEIDPDNAKSGTYGTFYFFTSSTGVEFVAFNMADFGMTGIRCVTTDTREEFTLSTSQNS